MGAGGFCAVDRANPDSAGGIYELSYEPKGGRPKKVLHLAGKGLCFDTGGYDVKTDGHKLFPYAKFVSTITKDDENPGFGPSAGPELSLKSFFEKRRAYLLNYPEIKKLPAK